MEREERGRDGKSKKEGGMYRITKKTAPVILVIKIVFGVPIK